MSKARSGNGERERKVVREREKERERESVEARTDERQTRARQPRRNAFGDLEFRVDYSGAGA